MLDSSLSDAPIDHLPQSSLNLRICDAGTSHHLVSRAIGVATRAAPHLAPVAGFLIPRLPTRPIASDALHTAAPTSSAMPICDAISMPWIAFNNAAFTNAITVDCDHADAEQLVDDFMRYLWAVDLDAPRPIIVRDPFTVRAHVTWFFARPIYTGPQQGGTLDRSARVPHPRCGAGRSQCCVARRSGIRQPPYQKPVRPGFLPSEIGPTG